MMRNVLRGRYATLIAVGVAATQLGGCETPLEQVPSRVSPEQLFWTLTLNHRAVTLSTTAPYDTVTLVAIARNVAGEPLSNQPETRLLPIGDQALIVNAKGLVRARGATGASGVRVIAELTYGGVTRADTAFVKVIANPNPKPIDRLSLDVQAGDSAIIPAPGALIDQRTKTFQLSAYDGDGDPISGIIAYYSANDQAIVVTNRQTGSTRTTGFAGTVVIRASAMVYGQTRSDSIVLTVTDPLLGILRYTGPNQTRNATIVRGGDIVWINSTTDSLDIVFDAPESALWPVGNSTFGLLVRDTSGNIATFPGDPNFNIFQPSAHAARARYFPNPGEYRFHSTRIPGISGVITVK